MTHSEAAVAALHAPEEGTEPLAVDSIPAATEHSERADSCVGRQEVWQLSWAACKAARGVLKRQDGFDTPVSASSRSAVKLETIERQLDSPRHAG